MSTDKPAKRPTFDELMANHKRMSGYEFQRWVFSQAIANGWNGTEPSVLGGELEEMKFKDALRFLRNWPSDEETR